MATSHVLRSCCDAICLCLGGLSGAVFGDFQWAKSHSDLILGNHCPADVKLCPWFDFRISSEFVKRTFKNGQIGPPLMCKLFGIIGVTRLSIHPDWMHDKNLGTDKVPRVYTRP